MVRVGATEGPIKILGNADGRSAGPVLSAGNSCSKTASSVEASATLRAVKAWSWSECRASMRKRRTLKGWVEFQAERFRAEDPFIHRFQCLAHSKRDVRLSKHVMLQIDARSNFDDR